MNKITKIGLISAVICLFSPLSLWAQTEIDPEFNPGRIISDAEILNTNSMSLTEVQSFLDKQNSFLANYTTYNSHGTPNKSAAEIIYEAATANYDCDGIELSEMPTEAEKILKCRHVTTVNPKFLLVLIQKEQSLVSDTELQQSQLDWATGYGCPDNWACNPYYKGFGKQVNSASLQFRYYMDHPGSYKYKAGNTYTFTNTNSQPMSVTVENTATAGLYNYTPHVFNGNYNFFKLWKKYFPKNPLIYPDGTLIRISGEVGVWLIDGGLKRPFTSHGALTSRFDEKKIIVVEKSVLDNYEKGDAIKFPNYSIIRTPDQKRYLLVDNTKRFIVSDEAFKKIGFNQNEIIEAPTGDLVSYSNGPNLTTTSTNITGTLMQNTKNGGVYFVQDNTKAPLIDKVLLSTKFKGKKIVKATETTLAKYTKIAPVLFGNGELLKSNASQAVYLIDNGQKRPFVSGETFETLGYDWKNVITVSPQLLSLYTLGTALSLPPTIQ
ncbi:hypothetical protein COT98_02720 [Candidatus Falkowbacteria bacterium CG10_big_fil_rev_8_21_14_0_10_39_9]|uniref:Uncharacterized protein n=1 Tax=Candidatus Falkowbacteria bacterium CG10_big_fil_rev_8_21_14_0_10_39_9 TaxID=1974566 RepID=A0A2M6WPC7_9BACT|nr:MAG: hypothetical protein COT98_02720 [Candidatus Falkowbacteria bacterium CG10_big_fil_rev_8_21_14_0_10_39_9]